jgi:glycyl-tRNA synthetase beta chain
VLSARLADAKFFWENDLRTVERQGMKAWTDQLANVTFHAKLGSQAERIERIAALAREIAPHVGTKPDLAEEAARIAKADLASEMVYEFPELQGLMGQYYAKAAGHDDGVPEACLEHWQPLGPSDDVPTAPVSVAVALADKIDTLTGFWAIDEKPTGSKDPFALRRAALGVIRLVLENDIRFEINRIVIAAYQEIAVAWALQYRLRRYLDPVAEKGVTDFFEGIDGEDNFLGNGVVTDALAGEKVLITDPATQFSSEPIYDLAQSTKDLSQDLLSFFHDRLKVFLRDKGIRHDIIDACIAMPGNDDLTLLVKRAEALAETLATDDGENLIQGFKRANNILTQAEEKDGVEYSYGADIKFAEDDAEKALFAALDAADAKIAPAMEAEDFSTAMTAMAALRAPIDAFFTDVQVNADSEILRRNRLNLLSRIRNICLSVADLTKIEG